ncbi:nucleotidyltransferase domain-containing protein [Synechococcus sp. CBW1004]|uniref:nucleotidyltransferase domain-containing protein n=1 Tax=Synechococcus sp. CBW1004 TaxID=1353136 RepID=UPI001E5A3295|nr:nucleotidyltransferase domain-containing protein [Synechococcus sp. CBW1004]
MPSSAGSVLRWPSFDQVIDQATRWATTQQQQNPDLLAVGVFGSYGRGDAGVGSDLDLVLILESCALPIWERLRRWDTGALPLACDLLVYSREEWQTLPSWNPRLAEVLGRDARWLAGHPPHPSSSPAILRR